jgi:hypothetical protein
VNDWGRDDIGATPGPGGVLLLMGIALGAATAFLLGTRPGQQVGKQMAERAGDWTAQAADAIARGRESLIASVEQQKAADSGPVRERPL